VENIQLVIGAGVFRPRLYLPRVAPSSFVLELSFIFTLPPGEQNSPLSKTWDPYQIK
jgi:hypothetical protein